MSVVSYLDCGCAIMEDGSRHFCPTCASETPYTDRSVSNRELFTDHELITKLMTERTAPDYVNAVYAQYVEPELNDKGKPSGKLALQTNVFKRVRNDWEDTGLKCMPLSNKSFTTKRVQTLGGFAILHTKKEEL